METAQVRICKADMRETSGDGTYFTAITSIAPGFALRDEALTGGKKLTIPATTDTFFVVLPLSGGVDIYDAAGNTAFVGVHQLASFFMKGGSDFFLFNPFDGEAVNVLIAVYEGGAFSKEAGFFTSEFSLETHNALLSLDVNGPDIQIGVFDGRQEGSVESGMDHFAFVINGAFEFQNRLLESRDALWLPGEERIAFEALSEHAIIFLARVPQHIS